MSGNLWGRKLLEIELLDTPYCGRSLTITKAMAQRSSVAGESSSGSPKSIRRGLRISYRLESTRRSKF
jgi:hypothetical protein